MIDLNTKRLNRDFFAQDTHQVARGLLGKMLVRSWRGKIYMARIYEVEAYVGEDDAACHASKGRTKRTEVMFGNPGRAYVYLIYGMHHCLNIVTEKEDYPAAVLLRGAGEYGGPGILCREMHISRAQNREDIVRSNKLYIADDGYVVSPSDVMSTPRVGVAYAGEDAKLPWRYIMKNIKF